MNIHDDKIYRKRATNGALRLLSTSMLCRSASSPLARARVKSRKGVQLLHVRKTKHLWFHKVHSRQLHSEDYLLSRSNTIKGVYASCHHSTGYKFEISMKCISCFQSTNFLFFFLLCSFVLLVFFSFSQTSNNNSSRINSEILYVTIHILTANEKY